MCSLQSRRRPPEPLPVVPAHRAAPRGARYSQRNTRGRHRCPTGRAPAARTAGKRCGPAPSGRGHGARHSRSGAAPATHRAPAPCPAAHSRSNPAALLAAPRSRPEVSPRLRRPGPAARPSWGRRQRRRPRTAHARPLRFRPRRPPGPR